MNRKDEILKLFPKELRALLGQVPAEFEDIQEIRLRAGQPVILVCKNREYMVGRGGELLGTAGEGADSFRRAPSSSVQPYRATREELRAAVDYMSSYSLYAAEEELRQKRSMAEYHLAQSQLARAMNRLRVSGRG